jgi:DNA-binding transcriptional ArsR family regulator
VPLTDAAMMRALAHPSRLALLEQLEVHESLTATEASALIGVSPTNCAFHLRALGSYGLVEEVGTGPGRRRPWRLVKQPLDFSDVQSDEEATVAAHALSDVMINQRLDRIRRVQARRQLEPPQWQDVFGGSRAAVIATSDEVAAMLVDIRAILSRYDGRLGKRRRPSGAREVELLLFAQPMLSPHPGETP